VYCRRVTWLFLCCGADHIKRLSEQQPLVIAVHSPVTDTQHGLAGQRRGSPAASVGQLTVTSQLSDTQHGLAGQRRGSPAASVGQLTVTSQLSDTRAVDATTSVTGLGKYLSLVIDWCVKI